MEKVKIDCKKIKTKEALHSIIARKMDFDKYYGNNLDALWDELTQLKEFRISLINSKYLKINLGEYGQKILELFEDLQKENDAYKIGLY